MLTVNVTCTRTREMMTLADVLKNFIWIFFLVNQINAYKNGKVSPQDPAILVGNDLILTCTITKNIPYNSSHLYFTFNDQVIPSSHYDIISPKSIALTKKNVSSSDSGKYYCLIRTGNDKDLYVSGQQVDVGYPPAAASHMTCMSRNWENMECDWCPEHEQENIHWKLIWTVDLEGNIPQWRNCTKYINKPGFGKCVCYFCGYGNLPYHECSILGEKTDFYPNRIYRMRVVATDGKRVSETKNFTMQLTPELVKPNPVQKLRTGKVESQRIEVMWKHPPRLESDHFPLVYYVNCSSKWGPPKVFNTTYENYTLTDLVPNTDFNISVQCKPFKGGYLSNAMAMVVTTKEDAPSIAVELSHGGFHVKPVSCDGRSCRKIRIFWKRIPLKYRNGIISSYIFRYNSTNQRQKESILLTYSRPRYSNVITDLSWNEPYSVSVIANTVVGPSPPATIFIDMSSKMPSKPEDIEIEYTQNGNSVMVMWSATEGASGYSIHHCLGQRDKGCQGDIETVKVEAGENQTRYFKNLTLPNVHDRIFALSTERGRSSSGMTEWECVYHFHGDPGIPNFWFSKAQEEKSLTIEWQKLVCGQQSRGRVLKYKVFWCKVTAPRRCEYGEENSAEVEAEEKYFQIQKLAPDTLYSVSMAAVAHRGMGGRSRSKSLRSLVSRPQGSPWNITVDNITASSIALSWWPSPVMNGKITHHKIFVQDGNTLMEFVVWDALLHTTLTELNGFTNYSIQLASCNKAGCSSNSSATSVLTETKAPAQIKKDDVTVKMKDDQHRSQAEIQWQAPYPPNGLVAYYEVLVWKEKMEKPEVHRVKERSLLFNVSCQNNVVAVNFSIIAVNIDRDHRVFKSTPSMPKPLDMCIGYGIPLPVIIVIGVVASACVVVLVLFICRKNLKKGYENCCGKDKIEVPERPPKVPLTVEVDAVEYGLPPSSASDRLIPEDNESVDSVGALIAARLPPVLINSSPGSRSSVGSNMIHRDTSPLMSVSSCTEDGAVCSDATGHSTHDEHEHENRPSPQTHGDINQNKAVKAGNVRLSSASSDIGYSQFGTLTPSGYVTLPENNLDTGSTILLDTGQSDFGIDSQGTELVTDYSKLGLQNLSEQENQNCKKGIDGNAVCDIEKMGSEKETASVAESLMHHMDGLHKSKHALMNSEIVSQQEPVTLRAEIETLEQDLTGKSVSVSAEPTQQQTVSKVKQGLQPASVLDPGQCSKLSGYVPVTEMLTKPDSDNSGPPVNIECSDTDDETVSPYSQVDQVTETDISDVLSQSTEKSRSPSEPPAQLPSDLPKTITLANSVSNSRDSLNISVTKSNSANSSLDSSRSRSSSLEESSPTSGLGSNGSSMESMDQSPVKHRHRKTQAKRISGYGNRNNSNNNTSQCVLEMDDFEQGQLQEEINLRRKNDGYV